MPDTDVSIATNHPREATLLRVILGIIFLLLCVGLVSPIITLNKFVLIESTFSVFSGVTELLKEGQIFLFFIITGFSIILPLLKVIVLTVLLSAKQDKAHKLDKYLRWMHLYGKWSMLDVFVVAVMVVAVKLGAVASVEMRYGLYLFAAAVILTMYVTEKVVSLTNDVNGGVKKQ